LKYRKQPVLKAAFERVNQKSRCHLCIKIVSEKFWAYVGAALGIILLMAFGL
jgi:hypothetical protein